MKLTTAQQLELALQVYDRLHPDEQEQWGRKPSKVRRGPSAATRRHGGDVMDHDKRTRLIRYITDNQLTVAEIVKLLGVSDQTVYRYRRQLAERQTA